MEDNLTHAVFCGHFAYERVLREWWRSCLTAFNSLCFTHAWITVGRATVSIATHICRWVLCVSRDTNIYNIEEHIIFAELFLWQWKGDWRHFIVSYSKRLLTDRIVVVVDITPPVSFTHNFLVDNKINHQAMSISLCISFCRCLNIAKSDHNLQNAFYF